MKNNYNRLIALAAWVILLAAALPAKAQLTLSLANPSQTVKSGETASFTGTLTNTGSGTIFLNGDDLGILGLSSDDTPFIKNAPFSLDAGTAYTGALFNVTVDSFVVPNTYTGSFSILGGQDSLTYDSIALQPFFVTVPQDVPVPEAASVFSFGLLLLLGIGGAAWSRRQRTVRSVK